MNNYKNNFEYISKVQNWFGTIGKAEILYKPQSLEELRYFMMNKQKNTKITVIGSCANSLISDKGISGVTIKLTSKDFTQTKVHSDINYSYVEIGAGALNSTVAMTLAENGLSGLEFLYTVPGTIGGSIKMNAGSFNQEIFDCLKWVKIMQYDGNILFLPKERISYGYRFTKMDGIILSASFRLKRSKKESIVKYMKDIMQKKSHSQPIKEKTGGSTFCNLTKEDYKDCGRLSKAWELIRSAGYAGYKVGNAYISEKHSNFLINDGELAADIDQLIHIVHEGVMKKFNIDLHLEIKKIGDW